MKSVLYGLGVIVLAGIVVWSAQSFAGKEAPASKCEKNEDCPAHHFCEYHCPASWTQTGLSVEEEFRRYCTGSCVPLTGKKGKAIKGPYDHVMKKNRDFAFKENSLITNKAPMNWKTAQNWCLSQKKKLVTINRSRMDCIVPKTKEEDLYREYGCLSELRHASKDRPEVDGVPSAVLQGLFPFLNDVSQVDNTCFWTQQSVQEKNWRARAWVIDVLDLRRDRKRRGHLRAIRLIPASGECFPLCE